jgi:hypothetical protein
VAAIRIVGASELNLVRKNNVWCVRERHDYPASFGQLSDALIKLRDLKVVEADTVGPSDLSRVDLDEPGASTNSGTRVEFADAQGKLIEAVLLGRKHMHESATPSPFGSSADGRYILLESNPREVFLISDALVTLQPSPQSWLNHDFFKVENLKIISLVSTNATNSWKVSRESDSAPWTLVDAKPGEILDTNKTHQAEKALSFPAFVDITPSADPAQNGMENPMVVTAETFDHFIYTLKISPKSPESTCRISVTVAAENLSDQKLKDKLVKGQALAPWVFIVNSWIMDPLTWDRARILEAKHEEAPADSVTTGTTPFAPALTSPFSLKQ